MKLYLLLFALIFFSATMPAQAQKGEKIAVIELFTTQGCSNCPPADRILQKVVEDYDGHVYALGCHVTFFDREDWRDEFSLPYCDARQSAYMDNGVANRRYTPQTIINGRFANKGNKEQMVWTGLRMGEATKEIIPLNVMIADDTLNISLPSLQLRKEADIWLFAYDNLHTKIIPSGETVDYVNVVRNIHKLLPWSGRAMEISFPIGHMPADNYVILAQYQDQTDIIAAGDTR